MLCILQIKRLPKKQAIILSTHLKCSQDKHTKISKSEFRKYIKVSKIYLSRDYLLGHRIYAQGVRVTGFYTPSLQQNKHHAKYFELRWSLTV